MSPFFLILQSIPIFFSGWGIREMSFMFLFELDKNLINSGEIFTISILIGLTIMLSTFTKFTFVIKKVSKFRL